MLSKLLLWMLPALYAASADDMTVQRWLDQKILTENGLRCEVRRFIERHIPPLTVPESAEVWRAQSEQIRQQVLDHVVYRNVPVEWYHGKPQIVWGRIIETGQGYLIRKLSYEALPGLWIPALLYEPTADVGKIPAILNVNGHAGPGKALPYEQMRSINLAKRGMLALHPDWLFYGELNHADLCHNRMAYLELCGISGLSVFYLAMKRGLDVLEMYPKTDKGRIAMTGLSGGGWQTIMLSSLDTRISAAAPNAGYIGFLSRTSNLADISDLEQHACDLLTVADYSHLTALLAPRPALLIYNANDECCFKSSRAYASLFEPVAPIYKLLNKADNFSYYENTTPGTHNYDQDNREKFYKFINRCFLPSMSDSIKAIDSEIPSDGEIYKYEDLIVGVPENNANFHTLAIEQSKTLPKNQISQALQPFSSLGDKATSYNSRKDAQDRLSKILHLMPMKANAIRVSHDNHLKLKTDHFRIVMNGEWTLPAVSIMADKRESVVLVIADQGKTMQANLVKHLVNQGMGVIVIDPLFMGECVPDSGPVWQYAQMLSAIGYRALGLQVAEINAVLDWACRHFRVKKLHLYADGWNAGVASLAACGMNTGKVKSVSILNCKSLKKLIENHHDYEEFPALFCFGLLEQFDVQELVELCSPVPVSMDF